MGCKKDKPSKRAKAGRYECTSCGVVRKKKKGLCDPEKISAKKDRD